AGASGGRELSRLSRRFRAAGRRSARPRTAAPPRSGRAARSACATLRSRARRGAQDRPRARFAPRGSSTRCARAAGGSCSRAPSPRPGVARSELRPPAALRGARRGSRPWRRRYRPRRMESRELDYDLPSELIAQHPAERRDESRLLVYSRATGAVEHRVFHELPGLVDALTVVNDTRVVPARIAIDEPRGEVLLLERVDGDIWEALARPTRRLRAGRRYGSVELLEHLGEGRWRLRLESEPDGAQFAGAVPLPPYIVEPLSDPERYQTVYANEQGSAAAPTAGLHFTDDVLAQLDVERVTLHVGLDTFRPLQAEKLEEHRIHGERYHVDPAASA